MRTALPSRLAGLAAVFSAFALLAACSRTSATPVPQAVAPPVLASPSTPVRSEAWKLERLVACYKDADQPAHAAVAGYLAWVASAESGPSGQEKRIPGIGELPSALVDRCSDQLHAAYIEGPAMRELDGASRSYLASLRDLSMQILPLHRYYEDQAWKDDGFARGKALHGRLMESAHQFAQASERFAAVLDREQRRHKPALLLELQDGGRRNARSDRLAGPVNGSK